MGKISNGTFKNDEDFDDSEEASELLASKEVDEKKNCIRFRISPSVSLKRNGEHSANERVRITRFTYIDPPNVKIHS